MARKVKVVDYDPNWKKQYKEEENKIKAILGDNCAGLYHIGSTVIKGMKAEPVIDILVVVKKMHMADGKIQEFLDAGYEYKGEYGVEGRRFYVKGGEQPTCHIHMFEEKCPKDITRFFSVSNYLATHEEERKEFEALKVRLAQEHAEDYDAYCKGKKEYIDSLEEKAVEWQLNQSKLGSYMAMGMSLGLATGCAVGYVLSEMILGMCIGIPVGLLFGMVVGRKKVGK